MGAETLIGLDSGNKSAALPRTPARTPLPWSRFPRHRLMHEFTGAEAIEASVTGPPRKRLPSRLS
jgi:hypothetical protein